MEALSHPDERQDPTPIRSVLPTTVKVYLYKGHLYLKLPGGKLKLMEYQPGMFFTTTGESIDLRGQDPIFAGIIMQKVDLRKKLRDGINFNKHLFPFRFRKSQGKFTLGYIMDRATRYIAAILRDDHILLLKQQFSPEYTCWVIPGGGRLEGESEAACIAREVREEAGLDVCVDGLLYEGPSHIHTFYQRFKVYRCTPQGEPHPGLIAAQENILETRWFDLRDDSQLSYDVINSAITCSVIDRIRQALGYKYKTHPGGEKMLVAADLRCENEFNPIALDTPLPRFSWVLQSTERGQVQTAYQVLVTAGETTLWDSGKVASSEQAVVYAGPPFTSRQGASWQVRVWDARGLPGPFSEACWFRLGLLQPSRLASRMDRVSCRLERKSALLPQRFHPRKTASLSLGLCSRAGLL